MSERMVRRFSEITIPSLAMKRGIPLLPVLLLGALAASHAFTLDIASNEVTEFGQGPRSIFVPGYVEVAFESGLDGALMVDSAYASTSRIEVPPPSGETPVEPSIDETAADTDPGYVKIANRKTSGQSPARQVTTFQPADSQHENPQGGWNAVPEAASAMLGLIGTLILLRRRR